MNLKSALQAFRKLEQHAPTNLLVLGGIAEWQWQCGYLAPSISAFEKLRGTEHALLPSALRIPLKPQPLPCPAFQYTLCVAVLSSLCSAPILPAILEPPQRRTG